MKTSISRNKPLTELITGTSTAQPSQSAVGCTTDESGFNSRQGQNISLFLAKSRQNLWPSHQKVPRALSEGAKRLSRKAKVKNEWRTTSLPSYVVMAWCIKDRETTIFNLSLIRWSCGKKNQRQSVNECLGINYCGTMYACIITDTYLLLAVFEVYGSEVALCFFDSLIIDAFSESKLWFPDVSACSQQLGVHVGVCHCYFGQLWLSLAHTDTHS